MKTTGFKKKTERKSKILELITEKDSISLVDLAGIMNTSLSTIRRDLDELANAGLIKRKFGSAQMIAPPGEEMPFAWRATLNVEEKRRIAKAALDMVQNGETIFLGGGSTVNELARLLPGQRRVTVITNALKVANILIDKIGIDVIVLGGSVLPEEQTIHSHLISTEIQQFHANKMFYGVQAVSLKHGLTMSRVVEVNTDRAIAKTVDEIILLVDHSKFGKNAPMAVMPISAVRTIITGNELDSRVKEELKAANVNLILV